MLYSSSGTYVWFGDKWNREREEASIHAAADPIIRC